MRSAKNIYRRFIDFEEQAADIYLRMASRFFPENKQLGALWLSMGVQEKEHAGLLQFCLAERLFATELPTEAEIRKTSGLFASLARRAADPDLTVHEAFAIAAKLETSEVNTIYTRLTTPLHGSMYLLRRKILSSMPSHLQQLASAGRKFEIPQKTLKVLERLARKPE